MLLAIIIFVNACGDKKASPSGEAEATQTEQEIATKKKKAIQKAEEEEAQREAEEAAQEEEARKAEEEEAQREAEEAAQEEEARKTEEEEAQREAEEAAQEEEARKVEEEKAQEEEAQREAEEAAQEEEVRKAKEEAKKIILVAPLEEESEITELNLDQIYFGYDQVELSGDAMSSLEISYEWIQENPGIKVLIAGHADERGSEEYNLGLGERRAKAVLHYLILLGADEEQFEIISFGEERPEVEGSTEEAWSKNRRVDFSKY